MRNRSIVSALVLCCGSAAASAQLFNTGNLVINELSQNGTGTMTNAAASQTWREWSPSLAAFTGDNYVWANGNFGSRMTANGTATSEGFITISRDGGYLTGVGYNAARGATNPAADTAAVTNRAVGAFDLSGSAGVISLISDTFSGQNIRSAVSNNGNNFYAVGSGSGVRALDASLGTTTTAASGASAIVNLRVMNYTQVNVAGGIGYGGLVVSTSGANGNLGLMSFDPVAGTLTGISGMFGLTGSPYDFVFTSPTTCYIADDSGFSGANSGGIRRFDYNSVNSTWVQTYILRTGLSSMVVQGSATTPTGVRGLTYDWANGVLYATTSTAAGAGGTQGLVAVIDTGVNSNFTLLGVSAAGTTWRSVEYVPTPGAAGLMGLGMLAAARRRRA